jgi:hypothetical protein
LCRVPDLPRPATATLSPHRGPSSSPFEPKLRRHRAYDSWPTHAGVARQTARIFSSTRPADAARSPAPGFRRRPRKC